MRLAQRVRQALNDSDSLVFPHSNFGLRASTTQTSNRTLEQLLNQNAFASKVRLDFISSEMTSEELQTSWMKGSQSEWTQSVHFQLTDLWQWTSVGYGKRQPSRTAPLTGCTILHSICFCGAVKRSTQQLIWMCQSGYMVLIALMEHFISHCYADGVSLLILVWDTNRDTLHCSLDARIG